MKFYTCIAITLFFALGCSSISRHPSSLDNNGEPVDDSFDTNLESYWGGSRQKEKEANTAVAEVIRNAVEAQYKARQEMAASNDRDGQKAQRVFGDLPKPVYATRDVHRKTNGCYKAQLQVAPHLKEAINTQISQDQQSGNADRRISLLQSPDDLGVFNEGAVYDAIVRLSNGHPGNRPDRMADARGFAVKVLPAQTLDQTSIADMDASDLNQKTALDILSINFPTFFMNDPIRYANLNKLALGSALDFKNNLAAKTQEFWSVFVSGELSSMERRLALFVNGSVIYSPLFQEYFSMVPSRLGKEGAVRAVKYSWVPVACSKPEQPTFAEEAKTQWAPWTKDHSYQFPPRSPNLTTSPRFKSQFPDDFLRVHTSERLSKGHFCFDLYFQLYRDPVSTNIEDSTDIWLRSEQERQWWLTEVVPNSIIWKTSLHNTESRDAYIQRIQEKKTAPAILAARLTLKGLSSQETEASLGNNKTCEDLSFNPWNGNIADHKPLGIVSRMKRKVYNASRRERHSLNGINDNSIERN